MREKCCTFYCSTQDSIYLNVWKSLHCKICQQCDNYENKKKQKLECKTLKKQIYASNNNNNTWCILQ